DREPLFEKPLTPSDVGKLNRLVIPKQHAEKYLPMNGGGGGTGTDSGAENGVLLDFEDEIGKTWRFRYSYWNSSQSYVLTKGWSRFVKEKRLDAGDVVTFSRHRSSRLFIGWRRRKPKNTITSPSPPPQTAIHSGGQNNAPKTTGKQQQQQNPPPCFFFSRNTGSRIPVTFTGSPVSKNQTAAGNSKRLRLFGVNLEFQSDEPEPSMPIDSPITVQ
ncbi:hypothetical protein M569_16044, partial [Genlisea aurea]